jgi:hypothetical protein
MAHSQKRNGVSDPANEVVTYISRDDTRTARSMLGGDPAIGSDEREAYRLRRGGSTSYIHSSDMRVNPAQFYGGDKDV